MRFKDWMEYADSDRVDARQSNNGLEQHNTQTPESKHANTLFGRSYMGADQVVTVPFSRLYGRKEKTLETIEGIREGRLSHTEGPVTVSRLDSPRGAFYMINGYHRAMQLMLAKGTMIQGKIDEYIPRIERTGGAYKSDVAQKVLIRDFLKSQPYFQQDQQQQNPVAPSVTPESVPDDSGFGR